MNIDRLLRESNPPTGQLASPGPQYLNPETGQPEVVQGRYGAPFAMLLGPDGHPISNSNRLPVADQASVDKLEQVRQLLESLESVGATAANQTAIADVLNTRATEATLASAVTKLTDLLNRLDQSLNVQFAEPQEVTLTGRKVDILVNRTDDNAALSWAQDRIALATTGWRNYAASGHTPIEIGEHKNLTISIFNDLDAGLRFIPEGIQFGMEIQNRLSWTHWTGTSISLDTTIPAGGRLNLSPMALPELENYWRYMTIILARQAPTTTGTLKIVVSGVRR